ncbi:hypothetical protein COCC4DRAFT_81564 [Bipolaris maydis ATCC 48331]|uniref:DJ-1/PfpI domain-containing protein n=2 Tax=Cochliobolus heterostrophus TaxID=5016 RepID=M2UZ15_COCH5|nr:uncharacterized protein COCC4DRAFT_81564 [Bipolaris maydis ATCC 48331]EMD93048.1 hypothetical protein COCHEDRAFT_1172867 [Bipolaris maydis C5]KAH7558512.1 hypothetical protein BM1_04649 [Bipolaris maydis]ENI04563.1 hypothetical protein COCC4DRAFT_81564 [Bipolaris maydis ATCC 48331]KAJ5025895.1 class I glutamine amidotransferase-like protein [Bipolaris maydis]KAJ5056428.1 DJ-1/PfpI family protein-like protein [Bipolaris maydis]
MSTTPLPSKFGLILFPGFQLLDVAGPLDAFNILGYTHNISLSILAATLDPVSTHNTLHAQQGSQISQSLVPTHTFDSAPDDLDVLLIPGGMGSRGEGSEERMGPLIDYLKKLDLSGQGKLKWVLTVCTGSEILARTGALDGRRATSNKRAFNNVKVLHPNVNWVAKARWVVDGNIWTSSGISAGTDLAYAWIAEVFGEDMAQTIADRSEYERNRDPGNDRYAEVWKAV